MSAAPAGQGAFRLTSLTASVYLPTFFFAIGQGAVLPIIPLFAKELGAPVAIASLIVAMRGLGTMLFDLPSGMLVSRIGDKGAMVAGTALVAIVAVGASLSGSVVVLAGLILLMGGGWSFWQLARLAYVSEVTPLEQRGRALSLVGGANRAGTFVGPIIGGFLGHQFGLEAAFYAQAVAGLCASGLMFIAIRGAGGTPVLSGHNATARMVSTIANHRRVFAVAGAPVIALQILRQGREVFLPLWGDSIGLDVARIGLAYSASSLVDAGIFYPVGFVMDRWGRKRVGVPSLLTMSLGLAILPLTSGVSGFVLVALLTGFGNGLGSGIIMTLGADFAPPDRRGEFLGVWRFIADAGSAGGPMVISSVVAVASLGAAAAVTAGIGLAGAAVFALFVPETLRGRPTIVAGPEAEAGATISRPR